MPQYLAVSLSALTRDVVGLVALTITTAAADGGAATEGLNYFYMT